MVNIRTFSSPPKKSITISSQYPFFPPPSSWRLHYVSGFAWIFHINGIIQRVVFCDCLAHFFIGLFDLSLLTSSSFEYSLFMSLSDIGIENIFSQSLSFMFIFFYSIFGRICFTLMSILIYFLMVCVFCALKIFVSSRPRKMSLLWFLFFQKFIGLAFMFRSGCFSWSVFSKNCFLRGWFFCVS